jgi:hypothetical protein
MSTIRIATLALGAIVFCGTTGAAAQKWTDRHAYCRAVGTIDVPDSRYIGPKDTREIGRLLFDVKEIPVEWRCMDGSVFACGTPNSPICGSMTPYEQFERY